MAQEATRLVQLIDRKPKSIAGSRFGSWSGILVPGFHKVTIEPGNKIQSVAGRVGFEFQGMMALGVFDHLPLRRRQPLKVGERSCIIDDPILARQHQARPADECGLGPARPGGR